MRRLILIRHAKSDRPPGVADRDRPLAARGREQAPLIGQYLAQEHLVPDLALVSSSRRTRETWALIAPCFTEKIAQRDEAQLYHAAPATILDCIRKVGTDAPSLAVVGHNPGFHELAAQLVGHGDRYAFARLRDNFPTCAIVILDFDIEDWAAVAPRGGRLDRFITPKMLGGEDSD